jgi:hypothetical protein
VPGSQGTDSEPVHCSELKLNTVTVTVTVTWPRRLPVLERKISTVYLLTGVCNCGVKQRTAASSNHCRAGGAAQAAGPGHLAQFLGPVPIAKRQNAVRLRPTHRPFIFLLLPGQIFIRSCILSGSLCDGHLFQDSHMNSGQGQPCFNGTRGEGFFLYNL